MEEMLLSIASIVLMVLTIILVIVLYGQLYIQIVNNTLGVDRIVRQRPIQVQRPRPRRRVRHVRPVIVERVYPEGANN